MSLQNEDIEILVKVRAILAEVDRASVARALEWLTMWNTSRPAPEK